MLIINIGGVNTGQYYWSITHFLCFYNILYLPCGSAIIFVALKGIFFFEYCWSSRFYDKTSEILVLPIYCAVNFDLDFSSVLPAKKQLCSQSLKMSRHISLFHCFILSFTILWCILCCLLLSSFCGCGMNAWCQSSICQPSQSCYRLILPLQHALSQTMRVLLSKMLVLELARCEGSLSNEMSLLISWCRSSICSFMSLIMASR